MQCFDLFTRGISHSLTTFRIHHVRYNRNQDDVWFILINYVIMFYVIC